TNSRERGLRSAGHVELFPDDGYPDRSGAWLRINRCRVWCTGGGRECNSREHILEGERSTPTALENGLHRPVSLVDCRGRRERCQAAWSRSENGNRGVLLSRSDSE